MLVPRLSGSIVNNSRMMRKICPFPLAGGMYFSTLSEKNNAPILSLLRIAEKANVAAISVICSRCESCPEPKSRDADISMSNITVSSRSSS